MPLRRPSSCTPIDPSIVPKVGYSCPGTCLDYVYDKLQTPYAFAFEIYCGPEYAEDLRQRWNEKMSAEGGQFFQTSSHLASEHFKVALAAGSGRGGATWGRLGRHLFGGPSQRGGSAKLGPNVRSIQSSRIRPKLARIRPNLARPNIARTRPHWGRSRPQLAMPTKLGPISAKLDQILRPDSNNCFEDFDLTGSRLRRSLAAAAKSCPDSIEFARFRQELARHRPNLGTFGKSGDLGQTCPGIGQI